MLNGICLFLRVVWEQTGLEIRDNGEVWYTVLDKTLYGGGPVKNRLF